MVQTLIYPKAVFYEYYEAKQNMTTSSSAALLITAGEKWLVCLSIKRVMALKEVHKQENAVRTNYEISHCPSRHCYQGHPSGFMVLRSIITNGGIA